MEVVRVVFHALILALLVRTFLFQPFNIPSGSMKSTLLVGDYLFVSKYSYGYSRYSIPFGPPLFDGRIWGSEPERGDVAVFKLPADNETDYIKRVIGLPGDRIQMIDGRLYINGEVVRREPMEDFVDVDYFGNRQRITRYREILPNGVSYQVLDIHRASFADNTREYEVPPGHYFLLGETRDTASDSWVTMVRGGVGFGPSHNFLGRAEIIFFSMDDSAEFWQVWRWPMAIRWGRLFKLVE